jgi:predicted nuclease with RNAse H fold
VFLFCYREGGRSRCAYVPAAAVTLVRQAIANGHELERRLVSEGRALIATHPRTVQEKPHARPES